MKNIFVFTILSVGALLHTAQPTHALQKKYTPTDLDTLKKVITKKKGKSKNTPYMPKTLQNFQSIPITKIAPLPTKDEYPTTESIKDLICSHYINPKEKNNIEVELFSTGHKVYVVYLKNTTPRKAIFFLKLTNENPKFIEIMTNIQKGMIGQAIHNAQLIDSKHIIPKKDLPIIAWIEHFFIYKNHQPFVLELSHAARGTTIKDILQNHEYIIPCAQALGKALGYFQQLFMQYNNSKNPNDWKTMRHGDFHYENVLYNVETHKIYFIDWSSMKTNASIDSDLKYLMTLSHLGFNNIDDKVSFFDTFLYTYIMSFPENLRLNLADYLIDQLLMKHFPHETSKSTFKIQNLDPQKKLMQQLQKSILIAKKLHAEINS